MNNSIQLESGMLSSKDAKSIKLCDRYYTIRNPWTVTLIRAISKLDVVELPKEATAMEGILLIPDYAPKVAAFIAVMAVGNVKHWGPLEWLKYRAAYRNAMCTTEHEKRESFLICLSLVSVHEAIDCIGMSVVMVDQFAKAKQ